jgi:hypothetical protein
MHPYSHSSVGYEVKIWAKQFFLLAIQGAWRAGSSPFAIAHLTYTESFNMWHLRDTVVYGCDTSP